jgi:hypothetical protein
MVLRGIVFSRAAMAIGSIIFSLTATGICSVVFHCATLVIGVVIFCHTALAICSIVVCRTPTAMPGKHNNQPKKDVQQRHQQQRQGNRQQPASMTKGQEGGTTQTPACYVMRKFGTYFSGTYVFLLVLRKSSYCTKVQYFVKYQNTHYREPMMLLSMDIMVVRFLEIGASNLLVSTQ